jgi:[ribosomal protein S5]-alanine N-acetyltransferase
MSALLPPWVSLQTPRLLLTPPTMADAPHVLGILSDPRTVEHNPSDRVDGLVQAVELLGRWRSQWERYGFGYWCLRTSADGDFIGYCGVKAVTFREEEALNLVYRLASRAWGRGLATEATTAVVAWAVHHVPNRRLIARVRPENLPSQRVATKAGLQRAPTLDDEGEDGPDLIFTLPPAAAV